MSASADPSTIYSFNNFELEYIVASEVKVWFSGDMAGRFDIEAIPFKQTQINTIRLRCSNLDKTIQQTLTGQGVTASGSRTITSQASFVDSANFICGLQYS